MALVRVPTFARGKYTAMEGEEVDFTDDFMRTLERNTNFLIANKILTPPVNYDGYDAAGNYLHNTTDAHGQIARVAFANGALHFDIDPADRLRDDVKKKKRIRTSGVFTKNYWYNDANGKRVEVGPAVVATTMLGNKRPAMRSPLIVPLSECSFGESTTPAEAWMIREELRSHGFVAQTFDEGKYAFSEVEIDPATLETKADEEQGMTDEQIQAAISSAVTKAVAPLNDQLATMTKENAELKGTVKSFSESTKREGDTLSFTESLVSDRKAQGQALPKLFLDKGRAILNDASFSEDQRKAVKDLMTLAPAALIGKQSTKKEGAADGGDEDESDDEPKNLAALKPRHFADITRHEELIANGLVSFAEKFPDKVKGIEKDQDAQIRRLHAYVRTRDLGDERADA